MVKKILITGIVGWLWSASVALAALPVLHVHVDAPLTSQMAYAQGTMLLWNDGDTTAQPTVAMPALFKTRGATSKQYSMKPALNMKLRTPDYASEADSALLDMRSCSSWILDAMAIDRICMRNRVAFDLWNDFSRLPYDTKFGGRNGTEGRFVEVYINNVYYGIYCLSDRINRKLLGLKKVEEFPTHYTLHGVLYKHGTQDIGNQNEPGYSEDSATCVVEWHNAWELTYPDNYGCAAIWAPLQDAYTNGQNLTYVKKYFYLENLVDFQLHIMALSISDNWGNKNRYFSIRDIAQGINGLNGVQRKIVLSPWDLDTSLGGRYDGSYYDGTYTNWAPASIVNNAPYPFSFLQQDADYKQLLRQRWKQARVGAFSTDSVNAKLERYRDLFLQSGAWERMVNHFETRTYKPKYVTDLSREIALIEEWYAQRFQEMDEYFGLPDGLETIDEETNGDKAYYDLLGRCLGNSAPQQPGVYIRQGKKVIINQ